MIRIFASALGTIGRVMRAETYVSTPAPTPTGPRTVRVVLNSAAAGATGVLAEVFTKLASGRIGVPLFTQGFSDSANNAALSFPAASAGTVTVDIGVPITVPVIANQVVRVNLHNSGFSSFVIDGVVL